MPESELHDYFVSLTKDLLGYYLHFKADSEETVRKYLSKTYFVKTGEGYWTLPWCSIYQDGLGVVSTGTFCPIDRTHEPLYAWQFEGIEL